MIMRGDGESLLAPLSQDAGQSELSSIAAK